MAKFAAAINRKTLFGTLSLLIAASCAVASAQQLQQGGNAARDRYVVNTVITLLNAQHLSRHPLDDEISERTIKSFLEQLDPMKMYFYQADIDEFMGHKDAIDDDLKAGDMKFAYQVFNRFLQRVDERVATVLEILKSPLDFTVDEEMNTDPDTALYAQSAEESADRWRKRIKYDLLVLKTDKVEGEEAIQRLNRRYKANASRMHQFKPDDLLEMYLTAMTSSYDPHTSYMSPSTLENFEIQMRLNLEGIGAALQSTDGYTEVSKIIAGGAAARQGDLKDKDRIISVGQGEEGEMVDVVDMRLNDVVDLIRGKAGTVVRLGVLPEGSSETKTIRIVRDKVELKDSEARGEVIESGTKADGSPYRVGYIDLPSFYMDMNEAKRGTADFKSTTRDVRKILNRFNDEKVDAVLLDLRYNGGGSLTEAINLTGLFIDYGPVVQVKDPENRVQQYDDLERGVAWDGPLVVAINKFSASASEILAGAIQDYKRGVIVGDKTTHGKGTVQSLLDLRAQLFRNLPNAPNLGALKITMQQFYRPNGDSTQKRGVVSDIELPSTTTLMDVGEADLDYSVKFDTVPPASFHGYSKVTPEIIAQLKSLTEARQHSSEDFARLRRNIDKYREQKERHAITLNEKKFFAEREELDASKEDEKNLQEQEKSDDVVYHKSFYNDEIVATTVDYLKLLQQVTVAAQ